MMTTLTSLLARGVWIEIHYRSWNLDGSVRVTPRKGSVD